MNVAVVTFHSLTPLMNATCSDAEHFVALASFTLRIGSQTFEELTATIKQSAGSRRDEGCFEVSSPAGYRGAFNHSAFRDALVAYTERMIADSRAMAPAPGNEASRAEARYEFPVIGGAAGW